MAHHAKQAADPGKALFRGLRIRLTLWYSGVLACLVLFFSIGLYISVRFMLYAPVDADAHRLASIQSRGWMLTNQACIQPEEPQDKPGSSFDPAPEKIYGIACYTPQGSLITSNTVGQQSPSFLDNALVQQVLQSGQSASGTISGDANSGPIYRYAQLVRSPSSNAIEGVIMVGISVRAQEQTLQSLLLALLLVGIIVPLGAAVGGFFLADRAIEPARIAFTRQQRFIADASHELRTPLTLMKADAEVLLRGQERLPEDDVVLLKDIVKEVDHMTLLAGNMLSLARLDAAPAHQEHEVVDLSTLANNIAQRIERVAEQQSINVQVSTPQPVMVIGDTLLLEQVMLILVDNAMKYNHPGGTITIGTAIEGKQARLEIKDTGIGIDSEHLPHLGERFYRVDKARSRETGGTGLGLSIARNIVSSHAGSLIHSSKPGEGTTAVLLLPAVQQAASQQMAAQQSLSR